MALPDPDGLDALSLSELRGLVVDLIGQVRALTDENRALRDEVARLKILPPRPPTRPSPSGMERASERAQVKPGKRRRGPVHERCVITREVVLKAAVPAGSRFKGYEDVVVRDLVLEPVVIRYRRERWCTPSGARIVAALPPGIVGGVGPHLRRFLLAAHVQGQVTSERLTTMLSGLGLMISKRQVVRLLCGPLDRFITEEQAVLRAGLATAAWISVDDTSARHARAEGVTTQIGDARFSAFRTGTSKSRLNFLALLRAGHGDFVVNAAALAYMRTRALAGSMIARMEGHPQRVFPDQAAWAAHLERLGICGMEGSLGPARLATEGALWSAIKAHGLLPGTVIVSDDAGQFALGKHALCWIHAERLVHKLDTFTDQ